MPTLEWIGKEKVINHHQEVPFRILEKKYTYNAENSENMIIHEYDSRDNPTMNLLAPMIVCLLFNVKAQSISEILLHFPEKEEALRRCFRGSFRKNKKKLKNI